MRSLLLTTIFILLMNTTLFATFEKAECDMDIEVELLAIERKDKKDQSRNETALQLQEDETQKSMMTGEEQQETKEEGKEE